MKKIFTFFAAMLFATSMWAADPTGCVDAFSGHNGSIYIKGWAADPDNTSATLEIHIYMYKQGVAEPVLGEGNTVANIDRADLAQTGYGTKHGFERYISTEGLAPGNYWINIYAINASGTSGTNARLHHYTNDDYLDFHVTISSQLTISYDANGGSGAPSSQQKRYGININLQSKGSLARTGYTADGWATSKGGNKAYNFGASYSGNASTTLYAHWTANTYKVKFNGNGSTSGSMSDQNFTYGTAQNLTANAFSKTGHTFAGWATSSTGAKAYNDKQSVNNLTATNGGTFNLYAKWNVNKYTITFNSNGGSAIDPITQDYGTAVSAPADPTREGYTFAGWDPAMPATMPAQNMTVVAQWDKIPVPVADLSKNMEIDLRDQQLGGDGSTGGSKYLIIDSENKYTYVDAEPASYNAFFEFANFNGAQHGYTNLKAAVPVDAGNYKLTLGACGYGNGAGTVKNDDFSETLASFNQQIEANTKCYHQNTTENIVTATFKVSTPMRIHITCGNYTPYFKLEKLEAQEFTVTFAAEGAEGSVPAAQNVVDGESLTIPANRTLYKEGYTLTGWNDGENTYAAGASYKPTANVTLTAVFTANAKELLNAQTETIVKWYFGESNGCPTMYLEGGAGNGFVVAQATVDGESQDVKLAIDATSGKFHNKDRGDKWAQVNANTVFSFPSKKDIDVAIEAYSGAAAYSLSDGILTVTAGDYYSYLQVTYPKSQATAIDPVTGNPSPVTLKVIENGMLLIIRDGKTYNAQGALVK